MSHPLSPSIVVNMLKANGIGKVKLFDADPWTMSALEGSGLEVMVGIPNYDLKRMSDDYDNAKHWVKENVTRYAHSGGVNIKYVDIVKLISNIFLLGISLPFPFKFFFC